MRKIKVLVVCATSLATSTMAAVKLEKEFRRRKIPVAIDKGRITDLGPLMDQTKPDIVIATAVVKRESDIPIFDGVPLLSGVGIDDLYKKIFAHVNTLLNKSDTQ